jgi:hypothetical protein
MRYLLLLPLLFSSCSMSQLKTAGQGVTTAGVVVAAAPSAPLLAFIGGLASFFGWEFVLAQDQVEEAEEENKELEEEIWNLTHDEWKKEKEGLLAPVYELARQVFWGVIGLIVFYFGGKFILKKFVLSKRDARRLEEWEDRVIEKTKERLNEESS